MPSSSTRPQEQLQDLILDRDVERRRRLVREEELRLAGERDRDHRALAHAAGKLVRIVRRAAPPRRECRRGREARRRAAPARLPARVPYARRALSSICSADRQDGIERRHRLLEDHRDLGAADGSQARGRCAQRSSPRQRRGHGHARWRAGCGRSARSVTLLPGSRLADETQDLARPHVEIDAIDGPQRAARGLEGDVRSLHAKERFDGRASSLHVEEIGEAVAGEAEAEAADARPRGPGRSIIHGACVKKFLPSATSTPHSAVGGCAPSPR